MTATIMNFVKLAVLVACAIAAYFLVPEAMAEEPEA